MTANEESNYGKIVAIEGRMVEPQKFPYKIIDSSLGMVDSARRRYAIECHTCL